MRISHLTRTALIGLISLGASGCGFLFVEGPPPGHEQMAFIPCTDSKLLPALDVVWAGLNAVGIIFYAAADEQDLEGVSRGAGIGVSAGQAVVWGIAASQGYKKVRECRAAKELLARRRMQGPDELGPQLFPIEPSDPLKGPLPLRQH